MRCRHILLWIIGLVVLVGCQNPTRPGYQIIVKDQAIQVEIAATDATRTQGLMHREKMATDSGMLFMFAGPQYVNFWMKNTFIPLSIAYIKSDGTIVQIEPMQPLNEETIRSIEPVRYALEMNQGWFERNSIKPGDKVIIPAHIREIEVE